MPIIKRVEHIVWLLLLKKRRLTFEHIWIFWKAEVQRRVKLNKKEMNLNQQSIIKWKINILIYYFGF